MVTRKVSEPVQDAVKAYLELAFGLTEASKKKAEKTVKKVAREFVGKSGATAVQLQGMAEELLATGNANREAVTRLVRVEMDRALSRVGLATAEEVATLTDRIEALERQLRDAKAQAAPAPSADSIAADSIAKPAAKQTGKQAPAEQLAAKQNAPKTVAKKTVAKKTIAQTSPVANTAPSESTAAKTRAAKKTAAAEISAAVKKTTAAKSVGAKSVAAKATAKRSVKKAPPTQATS